MIVTCRWCGSPHEVPATPEQIARWQGGELIQRAMPDLTPDQREMFISGTCGKCWDQMFPKDEEEMSE